MVRKSGSRSTFEFPSRVNLSGPSLYCTWLYGQDYSRCNKVDAVRLYASYRLNLLLNVPSSKVNIANLNNNLLTIIKHIYLDFLDLIFYLKGSARVYLLWPPCYNRYRYTQGKKMYNFIIIVNYNKIHILCKNIIVKNKIEKLITPFLNCSRL